MVLTNPKSVGTWDLYLLRRISRSEMSKKPKRTMPLSFYLLYRELIKTSTLVSEPLFCEIQQKQCITKNDDTLFWNCTFYIALVTLFERKHLEQIFTVFGVPFSTILTFLTFGFHDLLVLLCEWLSFMPKSTPLLHISHFAIYNHTSFEAGEILIIYGFYPAQCKQYLF